VNNVTFINPTVDLLEAYYHSINGQFTTDFPDNPPLEFNYTAPILPLEFEIPERGTKVRVLEYNSTVELVFQGTNVVAGADHPMHLHGYSFYVVGLGRGNFDVEKDPLKYNLVDPPYQNTIAVPYNGWAAIRFRADNPGMLNMSFFFNWEIKYILLISTHLIRSFETKFRKRKSSLTRYIYHVTSTCSNLNNSPTHRGLNSNLIKAICQPQ